MSIPISQHAAAGAVDLGALKRRDGSPGPALHAASAAIMQLRQAGLVCACGERIRTRSVEYFAVVNGPQGPALAGTRLCSPQCKLAATAEREALCRRDSQGRVTWLDEQRAATARTG